MVVSALPNVLQSETFNVKGVSMPLDKAGFLRDAVAPDLSLWAGLRTHEPFVTALAGAGGALTQVWIELGLIPYTGPAPVPGRPRATPAWSPLSVLRLATGLPVPNRLSCKNHVPWPIGGLVVRVSWLWTVQPNLGTEVDAFVAWGAPSQPVYPLENR